MKQKPQLAVSEYFWLAYALGRGAFAATWAAVTGWARGLDDPKLYKHHIMYSAARMLLDLTSIRQLQALNGTTREQYQTFAKKYKVEASMVEIEDGLYGCWIGNQAAEKTLLWLHGGGYVNPATDQHFALLLDMVKLAREKGKDLRVLILEYDLAPHEVYPTQLRQAVTTLKYLLNSGLRPSQIILGGDSAGGNLLGALILHLSKPHSEIPSLSLSGNLAGAIFVSPWISFQTDSPSFSKNRKKDMVTATALTRWSKCFMGSSPRDNYNHPIDAPPEWWKGIKVDKIAFVSGSSELFVDDIRTVVRKVKVHNPNVEYLEAVDEAHDAFMVDRAFGLKQGGLVSEKFINEWILARLS